MKKTLIALAVAGVSFNAAAIDLDKQATTNVPAYAQQIQLPAVLDENKTATDANDALAVTFELGFSATAGVKRYVRFDLTGAVFETPVAVGDLTESTSIALADVISAGGQEGDDFVIIEITPADDLEQNASLNLEIADINAQARTGSIQYRLYEDGIFAQNPDSSTAIANKSGKLYTVTTPLLTADKTDNNVQIDTKKFTDFVAAGTTTADTAALSTIKLGVTSGVLLQDGEVATATNVAALFDAVNIKVDGNFAAGKKKADGSLDETTAVLLAGTTLVDDSLTASSANFEIDDVADALGATPTEALDLSYAVNGETLLEKGVYNAVVSFTKVATGAEDYSFSSLNINPVATLGSTAGAPAEIDVTMKPGENAAFKQFVRVTNTSNFAGDFKITVINDDGDSKTVNLSALTGQATLAKHASTRQLSIDEIYQASGLAVTGEEKLRLIVNGDVETFDVQSYVLSVDATTLVKFD